MLERYMPERKWIYVIGPENDAFKVGKSKDLARRLGEYKVHRPNEASIAWSFWCRDRNADRIEGFLKRMLLKARRHGEWYEVSRKELADTFSWAMRRVRQPQILFEELIIKEIKRLHSINVFIADISTGERIGIAKLKPAGLEPNAPWTAEIGDGFRSKDRWKLADRLDGLSFSDVRSAYESVEDLVWQYRGF